CVSCNNSTGTCTPTAQGQVDPRNVCMDQGAASCGQNGKCDGSPGVCQVYPTQTVCSPTLFCDPALAAIDQLTCDGAGNCSVFTQVQDCGMGVCLAGDPPQCVSIDPGL